MALAGFAAHARAQQASGPVKSSPVVINNVRIFNGIDGALGLVTSLSRIVKSKQISAGLLTAPPSAIVIDGRGCVLMPGLTDAHWHMTMATNTMPNLQQADAGLMYANTVVEAHRTILRGFTTVRDIAGPVFGIKAAIDAGVIYWSPENRSMSRSLGTVRS